MEGWIDNKDVKVPQWALCTFEEAAKADAPTRNFADDFRTKSRSFSRHSDPDRICAGDRIDALMRVPSAVVTIVKPRVHENFKCVENRISNRN